MEKEEKITIEILYEKMYKFYRLGQIDQMRTCIKTAILYLENILKSSDEKFRQINTGNQNYQTRVGQGVFGEQVLCLCGFEKNEGILVMRNPDENSIRKSLEFLKQKYSYLENL